MDIKSLKIKNKTTYVINNNINISYIDDFNVYSLKVIKKESRIDANIYYSRCAVDPYDDIMMPICFFINNLIGYIEEIDGSSNKYLNVVSSLRDKNIISAINMIWRSIENKINPGIKIKDYGQFRFNSDIDLPLNTIITIISPIKTFFPKNIDYKKN